MAEFNRPWVFDNMPPLNVKGSNVSGNGLYLKIDIADIWYPKEGQFFKTRSYLTNSKGEPLQQRREWSMHFSTPTKQLELLGGPFGLGVYVGPIILACNGRAHVEGKQSRGNTTGVRCHRGIVRP